MKYLILREYFTAILKRSKIEADPNLVDSLVNGVREVEDQMKIIDRLTSLSEGKS
jgi:hypothetical protein